MIFAIVGLFKDPKPEPELGFEAALNEQLAQPFLHIITAGYVRGEGGQPTGFLGLVEADSFHQAKAFLDNSPFRRSGLYKDLWLGAYESEVGHIG
jgi:uncharacterized protein YciI